MGEAIQSFVDESLGFINSLLNGSTDGLRDVAIQIISTILLFLVVRFFFWNKVTDYLEARKKAIQTEFDDAKKANQDAALHKEEAAQELLELRKSSKGVIDDAKARGENERQAILVKAKKEADKLVDDAHKEIDSQIEKARNQINDEIVSVATLMAEKIIKKEIDNTKHKDLINEVTKEVAN